MSNIFFRCCTRIFDNNEITDEVYVRNSRNLPRWLWIAIAKSTGIKLHEQEKPMISSIFYLFTYGSGCGKF